MLLRKVLFGCIAVAARVALELCLFLFSQLEVLEKSSHDIALFEGALVIFVMA